jgi:hypothetical protein
MKAVFYPVGTRKTASSRYRCYLLADARKEFVIGRPGDGRWKGADAVVVQKRHDAPVVRIARKVRKAGKLVVLDYSDVWRFKEADQMPHIKRLADLCHLLTSSNRDDAHLLRQVTGRRVVVVPNAQDLSVYAHKNHRPVRKPTILWCGHSNNKQTLDIVWPALRSLAGEGVKFQVVLISWSRAFTSTADIPSGSTSGSS